MTGAYIDFRTSEGLVKQFNECEGVDFRGINNIKGVRERRRANNKKIKIDIKNPQGKIKN